LRDHVERVIYDRSTVRIVGSIPVASIGAEETKLQFRIEGQIGNAISRAKTRLVPEAGRLAAWLGPRWSGSILDQPLSEGRVVG
jgi:hypothetical protein